MVIVFSMMSRWGCAASTKLRAAESYEEEAGECAVEVISNTLVARFVLTITNHAPWCTGGHYTQY